MARRAPLAIALLASVACSDPAPAPPARPAPAHTEPARTEAETEPAPVAAVAPAVALGRDRVPVELSSAARAAQTAAESAEERGDAEAARDGWRAVLRLAPDFDAAHFALARALSRTADLEGAERELRIALAHDLGRFRSLWLEHEDFAALRSSPRGPALAAFTAELERLWQHAVEHGTPVVEWRTIATTPSYDVMRGDATEHAARGALWVPEWHRYVAVSPPRQHALFALVDPAHQRTVVVSAPIAVMDDVGYYLEHARVDVFGLDPSATLRSTLAPNATWAVRLDLDRESLGACVEDIWSGEDRCFTLEGTAASRVGNRSLTPDRVISAQGDEPSEPPPPAAGLALASGRLDTPRGPVQLGPLPRRSAGRIVAAPGADRAAVVSCACRREDDASPLCVVDAIDLAALRAIRLADDVHHVEVAFDRAGALYLQARHGGDREHGVEWSLARYPAPDAEPEPLPAGLILDRPIAGPCWPIRGP